MDNELKIPSRLHSVATEHVVAEASEIIDETNYDEGVKQTDINEEVILHADKLANLENRLSAVENLSEISVGGGDIQIANNASDITHGSAKIPTANAVNDALLNVGYFECSTAAATAAKVVSAPGYSLRSGGSIKIKMTVANTANEATLNIGGTGAKPLYYNGRRASSSNTWEDDETIEVYYDGTSYYANNVAGGSGDGVYDISVAHNGTAYVDLAAALGTNGINVPVNVRKGGMSIKFIQSSDSKYVQYRYMDTDANTVATFTNVANWQGADAQPTTGSNNLVKSGGIFESIYKATHISGEEIQTSLTNAWVSTDLGTDIRTINMRTDRLVTDLLNAQPLNIASQNPNLQCAVAVANSSYQVIRSYLYQTLPLDFNPKEGDYYVRFDFKDPTLPTTSTLVDSTLSIAGDISINDINDKIGVLEEKVVNITHSRIRNKYFADAIIRTLPGSSEDSSVGNRLKFIFKVSTGDKLFSRLNVLDKNNYMVIFDTLENAKKGSLDGILQQIYDGFTKHAIFAESEVDGYVSIVTKKDDNSAITDAEMQTMIDGMDIYIGPSANFIKNDNLKKIYFDSYAQFKYSATGIASADPTRVTCKSVIAVPYPSAELTFVLPPYIKAGIRCSGDASNLSTNLYWFINGDKVTLPSDVRFLIISLAKQVATGGSQPSIFNPQDAFSQDMNISVEEVSEYIERGELYIYYNDRYFGEIVDKNSAEEKYIKAVKYKFTNTLSTNSNPNRLPLLIHTSDVHGDYTRFNRVLDYADYIDADGVLTTGDMSAWNGNSHMDYINDAFKTHKSLGLICVGNHDAFGSNRQVSAQYENVMKAIIDKFGYSVNSVEYPTYYYKDIASKLIRVIGLNEFEKTNAAANQSYYSQTQINWLISVLAATPANYGVIIITHRPEEAISKIEGYDKFYQDSILYAQYQSLSITGHPISTIVDAFISRASINTQFTEVNPDTNTNETVNIVADFTGLNTGVEFLFFANGHEHSDRIGVAPNVTNRQLVLNVLSCIGLYDPSHPYYAEMSDIPRGNGSTQDAFNMYAIDRENKQVRIARIGSNKSSMLTDRDYMIVSYV